MITTIEEIIFKGARGADSNESQKARHLISSKLATNWDLQGKREVINAKLLLVQT